MAVTDLVAYSGGDGAARADRWAGLADDERKRAAMAAAQAHDAAALWEVTQSWLLLHGRKGANVSLLTLRRYQGAIGSLVTAWQGENLLHPSRLAGTRWLRRLEAQGQAPSTVRVTLAAARALYAALRSANATTADPFKDLFVAADPVPRWEKRQPYTDGDVETLRDKAEGPDEILVLLGAHGGLRVSEMVGLRWEDVDLQRGTLVVRKGKGGKKRTIPLSRTLTTALTAWQPYSRTATVLPYRDRYAAWYRLKKLAASAGVVPLGAHALRHTAGTRLVRESKGDLQRAAHFLGHADIATTQVYAKFSDQDLRRQLTEW